MSKSNTSIVVATKVVESFGRDIFGVSSFCGWLASKGGRLSGGRQVLAALGLAGVQDLTQKKVYNAVKKVYPLRDASGRMVVESKVVSSVWSPSPVVSVSVAFVAAILDGGCRVSLPAFYCKKGGALWAVPAGYVSEGVDLAAAVRSAADVEKVAAADLAAAEGSHSRAVRGHLSTIEIGEAEKTAAARAADLAAAEKKTAAARAAFEEWSDGLAAFKK